MKRPDTISPHPRTALVTGASKRIGRAIALELARAGLDIVLHSRQVDEAALQVMDEVAGFGREVIAMPADLADPDALRAAFGRACEKAGGIDMLVNNAAIFRNDRLAGFDLSNLREHMAVNLEAPLLLCSMFHDALPPGRAGQIVNIIDQRVLSPTGQYLSYDLSKAGLHAATMILARDLAPAVRVNAVAPGLVIPPDDGRDPGFDDRVERTPLRIRSDAGEIARAVRFIMETPSMTGQCIAIDSGRHMMAGLPA
ncbi:MAG: SDR family NAD(P)-dependent oxidoreductase [Geminicoccaceae bacterium]